MVEAPKMRRFKLEDWGPCQGLLMKKNFDLGIVVDFGYFIPSELINRTKHGFINVHPSLLPRVLESINWVLVYVLRYSV